MHDAEPAGYTPGRRKVARHALIWVYVAGAWREGHLHAWFQDDDGRWLAWIAYQHPEAWAHAAWGLFVYDPATIRPRRDGQTEPPTD